MANCQTCQYMAEPIKGYMTCYHPDHSVTHTLSKKEHDCLDYEIKEEPAQVDW